MAIKKLQNNFTTPEQSKRLLEFGVPADSADCFYDKQFYGGNIVQTRMYAEWRTRHDLFSGVLSDILIPCWSVGQLMGIIRICNLTAEKTWVYIEQDNIHAMITAIIDGVNNRMLDFSKLEE